jgi:hypothetical protein
MYKTIAAIMLIALNIVFSSAFAQEFSFKPAPANTYTPSTFSSTVPNKETALSPQDFANSSQKAYQEQQAKISALAAEQVSQEQINKAKAEQTAASKPAKKPNGTLEQLTKEPPKPISQESPSVTASPVPAEAPPVQSSPAAQPYTGFQSPPPSTTGGNSGSAPPSNNNQNSGGWGSGIKY